MTHNDLISIIDKVNKNISVVRQAELLNISRSSIYYHHAEISNTDIFTMNLIDQIYTKWPFFGKKKIKAVLNNQYNIPIGVKHTKTLMNAMGLEAIYPKKKNWLSNPCKGHKIYPYLLNKYQIIRPNQVWSADITYVKLQNGFCYLVAIIDWFSRYVIGWRLSNTLEIDFCLDVYNEAINVNKNIPDIFNSDQGSHFTSPKFIKISEDNNIQISMDGRGRYLDNIFVERLWRSIKQENIYLNNYADVRETKEGLKQYFDFYNTERPHQSLNYKTPAEIHFR